jgi:pimeloyl-ACP methyl ester carboxylesterase
MTACALEFATSGDGTPIAFSRTGSGTPLVLVHGTGAGRGRWDHQVQPLLAERFTVYALDRRGRGASGDAQAYALSQEGDDIAAVLDRVGGAVVLLGHSWGGICALEAAGRNELAGAIDALILYEPPLPVGVEIYSPGVLDRLDELLERGEREAVVTTFLTDVVRVPADELALMRSRSNWPERVAAAASLVREVRAHEHYRFEPARWERLESPTLLLLGADSPRFFGAAIETLHRALPVSTVRVLAGQQHAAMDTAPELFADEVVRFVDGEVGVQ